MESPERGALTLVRFVSVLLVVASILELGLYWAECSEPTHRVPVRVVPVIERLIPALLGFAGLIKARALAAWLSEEVDLYIIHPEIQGYLPTILHAPLPFVRHPEHEKFLEESWLFEAITETYLPMVQVFEGWQRDQIDAKITLSLSPTLCAMLLDPLLRARYERHLNGLIDLAENEIHRTHWDRNFRELAWMYHHKFSLARE